jgi:hypothetical protein
MYELRSWGNRETGEAHYLVDGVEVTKAEYDRLPSGAEFVAPDGSRRTKP